MSDLPTPITRKEQFLNSIARGNTSDLPTPITREEEYLDAIAKSGGGGSAGVSSFNGRTGVVVSKSGDYTAEQVGALPADTPIPSLDSELNTTSENGIKNKPVAENILAIVNEYGAKNLLPNNATSQELSGVTFTVNANGSITLSGSLQGASYTGINIVDEFSIPIDCIMNGMPSNVPHVFIECVATDWSGVSIRDYGSGAYINVSALAGKSVLVRIIVESGADLNNPITIYPMIRDARITDPTYVPYAMTNRELTKRVKGIYKKLSLLTANGGTESINISAFDTGRAYIVMCSGNYNPLWRYMGLLCITAGSNGYLYDIVTDATLTVSVSENTLTLRNNNYDNAQVVGVTIMG